jgi:hypothetical protein
MLKKNIEKQERKNRATWSPYYSRVTKDKTKYNRKVKHKKEVLKVNKYPMIASSEVGKTLTKEQKEKIIKKWKEKHRKDYTSSL